MIERVSSEGLVRTKAPFYHRPHLRREKNNVGACEEPEKEGQREDEEEEERIGLMFWRQYLLGVDEEQLPRLEPDQDLHRPLSLETEEVLRIQMLFERMLPAL